MTKLSALNRKKMTLFEFAWYGFNYMVGIGFVGSFALLCATSGPKRNQNIGMNVLWVLAVVAVIAGIVAWTFAKMARVHKSTKNGAAYIYTRSSFGRFTGFFVLFIQYIALPFLITIQILFLMKGTFTGGYSGDNPFGNAFNFAGNFSNLFLDLIGVAIYLGAAFTLFLGMRVFKLTQNWTTGIRWFISGLLIIAGLYLMAKNNYYSYWTKPVSQGGGGHFSLAGILVAFNTFFFYFAGFETFSTAGQNISNPQRNVPIALMIIISAATALYIIVGFIFFGAFKGGGVSGASHFQQNMNIATWAAFNSKWLLWVGASIMFFAQLMMKVQVAIQNALFGGTSLQPLAKEGYIPDYFRKLGKDNLPVHASLLNLGITSIIIFLWLIVPDIVVATGKVSSHTMAQAFNVNAFASASSTITIFVYIVVVIAALHLAAQNKIRMRVWEWIAFSLVVPVLILIFGYHFYDLFHQSIFNHHLASSQKTANIISVTVEMVFYGVGVATGVCLYVFYYRPKLQARMLNNPALQEALDSDFFVIDDWFFVSKRIKNELDAYKKRNFALWENHTNQNYKLANHIDQEVEAVYQQYKHLEQEQISHEEDVVEE